MNQPDSESMSYLAQLIRSLAALFLIGVLIGCTDSSSVNPHRTLNQLDVDDEAVVKLLQTLTDRVREKPDDGQRWGTLALAYSANGFLATAQMMYDEARQIDPNTAEWTYQLAILRAEAGDYISAARLMSEALQLDDSYAPGFVWFGQWSLELNDLEAAQIAFKRAQELAIGPVSQIGLARVELAKSNYAQALSMLEPLVASYPHPLVHQLRSRAFRGLQQPIKAAEAQSLATANVSLWWDDPWLDERKRYTVGFNAKLSAVEDLIQQERFPDALLILDELRLLQPNNVALRYQNALVELQIGQESKARDHLLHSLKFDSEHYLSHLLLAQIYENQKLTEKSKEHLNTVTEIHPTLSAPHEQLAKLYIREGDHPEALKAIERAIELDAKDREVFYYAGVLKGIDGLWQDCVEYFKRAVVVDPRYTDAYKGLAQCYGELGEIEIASENLRMARSLGLPTAEYQEILEWLEQLER